MVMYRMLTTRRFIMSDQLSTSDGLAPKKNLLKEILMPLGFIAAYFILQLWILPMFGVQT